MEAGMITTKEIICCTCGKIVIKKLTEIKRQQKRGKTKFYCNKSCSGKDNSSHLEKFKNHFKTVKYIKQPDEYSDFKWYIKRIKYSSKKKNNAFDVDLDYLKNLWEKQHGICPITKEQLELRTHTSKNVAHPYSASLDRIDNNKGYVKGNVRFVSLIFNYARNNFSDSDVLEFCHKVTKNNEL